MRIGGGARKYPSKTDLTERLVGIDRYALIEIYGYVDMDNNLSSFYAGKTVLVTGNTGFKGSWLCAWLKELGANVVGFALNPPGQPNNFEASRLAGRMTGVTGDVCNREEIGRCFAEIRPDVVIHLAAQALVRLSYDDPVNTFDANVMGTVNVLDAAVHCDSVKSLVSITSDKCYRNQNWIWGYRENDELGGYDPYSASKACSELVVRCYSDSRFQKVNASRSFLPIASARAGNVIGGGDWARDRIIPDIVRAIGNEDDIVIRSPNATRPWQHVLEPLSGYLWLAARMAEDPESYLGGWNFGPADEDIWTVEAMVSELLERWDPISTALRIEEDTSGAESKLLRLDCTKAHEHLGWRAIWSVSEALDAIADWYKAFLEDPDRDMYPVLVEQIDLYTKRAAEKNVVWARRT
jgi:CDP-glucose 4,6-dehydratase